MISLLLLISFASVFSSLLVHLSARLPHKMNYEMTLLWYIWDLQAPQYIKPCKFDLHVQKRNCITTYCPINEKPCMVVTIQIWKNLQHHATWHDDHMWKFKLHVLDAQGLSVSHKRVGFAKLHNCVLNFLGGSQSWIICQTPQIGFWSLGS